MRNDSRWVCTVIMGAVLCSGLLGQGQRPIYSPDTLWKILSRASEIQHAGRASVIIFDLDETLINSQPRTLRILTEFVSDERMARLFPKEMRRLKHLRLKDIRYYVSDTLADLGIRNESLLKELEAYWAPRYFSSEYCTLDSPVSGAAAYVRAVHAAGATVVYLTGRDRPRMERGTLDNLDANGFPLDENTRLIMKPTKDLEDTVFKRSAFETIRTYGTIIGGFDNEPANVNALRDAFPDSEIVLLDTAHTRKPDVPYLDVQWIRDFHLFSAMGEGR